jgi:transcriptional regulator with XRE-family HTH domain
VAELKIGRGRRQVSEAKSKYKSFDQHIGNQIRELRLKLGMSQTRLGQALGVSFQQIQKYENGKNRLSAGQLWLVCNYFGVPVATMFDGVSTQMFKAKK